MTSRIEENFSKTLLFQFSNFSKTLLFCLFIIFKRAQRISIPSNYFYLFYQNNKLMDCLWHNKPFWKLKSAYFGNYTINFLNCTIEVLTRPKKQVCRNYDVISMMMLIVNSIQQVSALTQLVGGTLVE